MGNTIPMYITVYSTDNYMYICMSVLHTTTYSTSAALRAQYVIALCADARK